MGEVSIRAVLMRGGTSKGVFVSRTLVPEDRAARDALMLGLMGSPDPMQIDGLGGTHSSTSKVMAVGPSSRADCDVDYLFVQCSISEPVADYSANCGNLTAAVGAYAVNEGLVPATEPVTVVRMFNENTGKRVLAHVPVEDGMAATQGDCAIAGVPGTGAAIVTEYLDPAGSRFGALLPTGRTRERLDVAGLGAVEVSIVDATIPIVFIAPEAVGLAGDELPEVLNKDAGLLARLEAVRAAAAVQLGAAASLEAAARESVATPKIGWVSAPRDAPVVGGGTLRAGEIDVLARMVSVGRVHHALPLTGLMCVAVASLLPGTLAYRGAGGSGRVRVGHPKGMAAARVDMDAAGAVRSVSVERTARRLMVGEVFLRDAAAAAMRAA